MNLTLRQSTLLIIASYVIGMIAALPMVIKQNDSFLVPGLVISIVLFLIGIIGMLKILLKKR